MNSIVVYLRGTSSSSIVAPASDVFLYLIVPYNYFLSNLIGSSGSAYVLRRYYNMLQYVYSIEVGTSSRKMPRTTGFMLTNPPDYVRR